MSYHSSSIHNLTSTAFFIKNIRMSGINFYIPFRAIVPVYFNYVKN